MLWGRDPHSVVLVGSCSTHINSHVLWGPRPYGYVACGEWGPTALRVGTNSLQSGAAVGTSSPRCGEAVGTSSPKRGEAVGTRSLQGYA